MHSTHLPKPEKTYSRFHLREGERRATAELMSAVCAVPHAHRHYPLSLSARLCLALFESREGRVGRTFLPRSGRELSLSTRKSRFSSVEEI